MRRPAIALLLALVGGSASAEPELLVTPNHAVRLPISGDTATVMIGDPAVADVMVINRHTIFVRGKGYGRTELTVLDASGRPVWRGDVAVISPDHGQVTVMRALKPTDYSCAASRDCAPQSTGTAGTGPNPSAQSSPPKTMSGNQPASLPAPGPF
jgi:Flp pilus assembly secretin CpaC